MINNQERAALVVGIDASRNRSGGAKAHLIGILQDGDPLAHEIREVHVWAYKELMDALPDAPWLIKHNPPELECSLLRQVWWQYASLPGEARRFGCDILLNTDAASVCPFRPAVVMSRDMLSYEAREMRRHLFSRAWVRLLLLRFIQTASIRRADGVLFLTQYAAEVIQRFTGSLKSVAVIPHGVGDAFRQPTAGGDWPEKEVQKTVRCLYVSNALPYKHQWVVVRAIRELRSRGYDVALSLAGAGVGSAARLLAQEVASADPAGEFVEITGFLRHGDVPAYLANADLFIFASSCENMPITLLEAMASGLPIACSNRGPMPEVLQDGGVYFDPEDVSSISTAIERLITNRDLRMSMARGARALAEQYSWRRCGSETWSFMHAVLRRSQGTPRFDSTRPQRPEKRCKNSA